METINNVFSAMQTFLNKAQSMGAIKEFSLVASDLNGCDLKEFDGILNEFMGTINNIPALPTSCENSSYTIDVLESEEPIDVEKETASSSTSVKINLVQSQDDKSEALPTSCENSSHTMDISESEPIDETASSSTSVKDNLVQIQVDQSEIKRRISAFISRKRKEVDEWNVQEFCSRPYVEEQNPLWEQVDSCARVDTIFVPRFGSKSHVKVSKVENRWGPQTQGRFEAKKIKKEPGTEATPEQTDVSLETIQERLHNMESHLKLKSESSLRSSIFQRLKELENRILFLEGISPDYFHLAGSNFCSPKKSDSGKEKMYSNWSVDDIQKRMQSLRDSLKTKSVQFKKEVSD